MSFVDLMGNDVWSEADIVNRTEAMIASQVPRVEILRRKVEGMLLGQYMLTQEEQTELAGYAAAAFAAGQLADEARADMALLRQVFDYEAAVRDGAELPAVTQAALDLYALRNPPPPPEEPI